VLLLALMFVVLGRLLYLVAIRCRARDDPDSTPVPAGP